MDAEVIGPGNRHMSSKTLQAWETHFSHQDKHEHGSIHWQCGQQEFQGTSLLCWGSSELLSSTCTPLTAVVVPGSLCRTGVRADIWLDAPRPLGWAFRGQKGADPLVQACSDAPVEMVIKEAFFWPEIAIEFSAQHLFFFPQPSDNCLVLDAGCLPFSLSKHC